MSVKVYVLEQDSLNMDLEFGIRETTCRRDSGADPSTCDFQRGYYAVSGAGNAESQKLICRSALCLPKTHFKEQETEAAGVT